MNEDELKEMELQLEGIDDFFASIAEFALKVRDFNERQRILIENQREVNKRREVMPDLDYSKVERDFALFQKIIRRRYEILTSIGSLWKNSWDGESILLKEWKESLKQGEKP